MADEDKKQSFNWEEPVELLPKNARTEEIMKKRAEEEEIRRQKQEEIRLMKEKEEKQKRLKERNAKAEQDKRDKMERDMKARKQEEESQLNKLEGRMIIFFEQLFTDKTPIEVSMTGLELGASRTSMVAKNIKNNKSLMSLHMARKNISDNDGCQLAWMLNTNKHLRKLELEGNQLGPKTISQLGKMLKSNETLKSLDLESNQLTLGGSTFWGMVDFIDFLDFNKTLLTLNVANNDLDENCGQRFADKLQNNFTLIDLDFSNNNFSMEDSRQIQVYMKRNKALYDAERIKEWRERKNMRGEDESLRKMYMGENANKEQAIIEEEAREIREAELNEKWQKFMLENEIQKQQIIQQLVEASALRKNKGKNKKKKKKK